VSRQGAAPLRVLVVDDSAVVRQAVSGILSATGEFEVTPAADPLIAMLHLRLRRPDVILLDLEMPRMDGLTFLRHIMATDPIPVVMLSSGQGHSAELSVRALEEGAVEIVAKPRVGARAHFEASAPALVAVLVAAASTHPGRLVRPVGRPAIRVSPTDAPRVAGLAASDGRLVVMGASTGGTEAFRAILSALTVDVPGIVAVQHMPAPFTAAFAARLATECRIAVKEAEEGDVVRAGRALIAPGGRHTRVERRAGELVVTLSDGEPVSQHRPSVDVLFRSAAIASGRRALGVLLTGMGADGADGMAALKRAGASTLAQDEASCVIFGMPRAAILRQAVSAVVPLDRMCEAILERVRLARAGEAAGDRVLNAAGSPPTGGSAR
jgi:two-component system, chemotaxis family, protein-glutamate methylesterase/glutaminase